MQHSTLYAIAVTTMIASSSIRSIGASIPSIIRSAGAPFRRRIGTATKNNAFLSMNSKRYSPSSALLGLHYLRGGGDGANNNDGMEQEINSATTLASCRREFSSSSGDNATTASEEEGKSFVKLADPAPGSRKISS